jgi:C1A family cysteine protease
MSRKYFAACGLGLVMSWSAWADPPASFDLRDVNGQNYVTSVKSQVGGTCWTHGIMAAIESNLLMTGIWADEGEDGEPNLAEYHLDWWNGFNQFYNEDLDPPDGGGLTVHQGGDYRVGSAYLSRCEGAVRDIDGQLYVEPPLHNDPSFHHYYPRHVEWYVAGTDLERINNIKQAIMDHGAVGTCMCSDGQFMSNLRHYQPPSNPLDPNHAIAIIGWRDWKITQAPLPGAWLCKNSWGEGWGNDGYFWISYYDKHAGQHPEMGAISFRDVEPLRYDNVYYHDYHGWRDTLQGVTEAMNAFTATMTHSGIQSLESVSFFTAADEVTFNVRVYDRFEGGQLLDEIAGATGTLTTTGFHTVDLDAPTWLSAGDDFYVALELSSGGHPYDRTSEVPVLLGAKSRVLVESTAKPGQSYYRIGGAWLDLYDDNDTANFCIKALSVDVPYLTIELPDGAPEELVPLEPTTIQLRIVPGTEQYAEDTGRLHYRYDGGPFLTVLFVPVGGDLYEATLPPASCERAPEFYFSVQGDGGAVATNPIDAPATTYGALVGHRVVIMHDDFETDKGWTVTSDCIDGMWERGETNHPQFGLPRHDYDGSGKSYLTGNDDDPFEAHDVDGGSTTLTSPVGDVPADTLITFAWWLNDSSSLPIGPEDWLKVEVATDPGGTNWQTLRTYSAAMEAWRLDVIDVGSEVGPSATMRIRFVAADNPPDSQVQAAIDAFDVSRIVCDDTRCIGDLNGDGVRDLSDLGILLASYELDAGGDCDLDGDTDLSDLGILLASYEQACP